MFDSEGPEQVSKIGDGGMCRLPTSSFRVQFSPINDFEKGIGVAVVVDGVLCTGKDAAVQMLTKRVEDLYEKWLEHVSK